MCNAQHIKLLIEAPSFYYNNLALPMAFIRDPDSQMLSYLFCDVFKRFCHNQLRQNNQWCHNHRLNGRSSPVLTATCLSYGSLCDFIFFPNRPGGNTPQLILTQNGSNDVDSRTDVPFGVKIETF